MRTAIIIGAGIGGLAAAVALRRAGLRVKVLERAPEVREAGAGLTLWPNALRALSELGLDEIANQAGLAGSGGIRSWRGEVLSHISQAELARRYGDPIVFFHRAELLAALLEAAGGVDAVQAGRACSSVQQDETGVTARFEAGASERGDLLVGADGIHSVVRAALFGQAPVRYSGYTCWRGVAPFPLERIAPYSGEMWGRGRRFGIVPLKGDRVYWFATANAPAGRPDSAAGRKQELLFLLKEFPDYVAALIQATPEGAILRNDINDRPPLSRWSVGRVTLLGDAAHPMTPNLGQGACQALEDAAVLGQVLKENPSVESALQEYERRRLAHANEVVATSWTIGKVAQWSNPLACWLRNRLYAGLSHERRMQMLDKVVAHPL